MRKTIRLSLFACAAVASLAFASTALASFSPKLVVSSEGTAARVGVVVSNADDPSAKASFYIPAAYQVGAPTPGTKLGDVTATAAAADLGGAVLPLTGELDAIAPTATTQAAAKQCGITPAQTWDLHLTAAGQTLDIPMFVVPGAANEVAAGYSNKLVVCLPPPDVPAGTPGRAVFGAKLLSATFTASAITQPTTAGDYRWTSVWTPYNPGKGTPNAAGTVESQALRHVPTALSLTTKKTKVTKTTTVRVKGKKVKRKKVTTVVRWSATATANSAAPSSSTVATVIAGTLASGKKTGGASGSFVLAAGKSATITSTATINSDTGSIPTGQPANAAGDLWYHDLGSGACTPTTALTGGLPCINATVGGDILKATAKVTGYKK
jgi:hypothetical protein